MFPVFSFLSECARNPFCPCSSHAERQRGANHIPSQVAIAIDKFLVEVSEVSEEKIESVISGWEAALEKKDVDKALSFVAEDAVWFTNEGTFKGKQEWRRYLTWMWKTIADAKFNEAGIGVIVKGNKAVSQYTMEGKTTDGIKFEVPGVCLYEFKNEKIQQHTTIVDRLLLVKQVAKGTVEKRLVGSLVKRAEKGLH
jgi:ketosteroid isomerase-like protein